ncbi:MAG: rhodanese-like domain-containing protein [Bacteroidales bacterium]
MNNSQTQLLNIGAFLFVGLAVLFMLVQYLIGPDYKMNNAGMLDEAVNHNRWVMPVDIKNMAESNRLQDYLLVDLRETVDYNHGSLPGAINIPFDELLEKRSLKQLKTKKPVLLFSEKESRTSVAGLLLSGKGIKNVFVMANDYNYVKENVLESYKPSSAYINSETAEYDYSRFFKAAPQQAAQPAASKPKIIKTEVISVGGGC